MDKPMVSPTIFLQAKAPQSHSEVLRKSLIERRIDPQLLYHTPKQVQKWLEVYRQFAPVQISNETRGTYQDCFQDVLSRRHNSSPLVISLGCGAGTKEMPLIKALSDRDATVDYVPIDVSEKLVQEACQSAAVLGAGAHFHPVVGDLKASQILRTRLDLTFGASRPRIFIFFGMLTLMSHLDAKTMLHPLLSKGDLLILSANLLGKTESKEALESIVSQYDNLATRDWLSCFLSDLGCETHTGFLQFGAVFGLDPFEPHEIFADYRFNDPLEFECEGWTQSIHRGETLRLFRSFRYTPSRVTRFFDSLALINQGSWLNPKGDEGVFIGSCG
jgi:hypothetical protein